MDIMKLATQILGSKLGQSEQGAPQNDLLQSVIGNLLGGNSNQGIDLGDLVGKLQGGDLANLAKSWLGDGPNDDISEGQVESLLGADKIKQAAGQLNADPSELLAGLKDLIPQVVDKSSRGGELLESVGGLSGLAELAGKFLKR